MAYASQEDPCNKLGLRDFKENLAVRVSFDMLTMHLSHLSMFEH